MMRTCHSNRRMSALRQAVACIDYISVCMLCTLLAYDGIQIAGMKHQISGIGSTGLTTQQRMLATMQCAGCCVKKKLTGYPCSFWCLRASVQAHLHIVLLEALLKLGPAVLQSVGVHREGNPVRMLSAPVQPVHLRAVLLHYALCHLQAAAVHWQPKRLAGLLSGQMAIYQASCPCWHGCCPGCSV